MPGPVPSTRARASRSLTATVVVTAVALGFFVVTAARALAGTAGWAAFVARYPGVASAPSFTPVGFPAWLAWEHGLAAFLLLFIVTSGLRIRAGGRPPAFVTREPARIPLPRGKPRRLGLHTWWHLAVDSLWILVGVSTLVLLFATGQWTRIVPTSLDVIPNAITAAVQYASFHWPRHDGWIEYNALQLLAYFATTFLAAPLAVVTGLRLSRAWPASWARPTGLLGDTAARRIHRVLLWYFLAFTAVHVFLVLATGALRNLNHLFALRDDESWLGAIVFAVCVVVGGAIFLAVTPSVQKRLAKLWGTVR